MKEMLVNVAGNVRGMEGFQGKGRIRDWRKDVCRMVRRWRKRKERLENVNLECCGTEE